MRITISNRIIYPVLLSLPVLFVCMLIHLHINSITISELDRLVICTIYLCVVIVLLAVKEGSKKDSTIIVFVVSFFTLCLGTYATNIGNASFYGKHVFQTTNTISYENEARGLIYICTSLFFISIGYFGTPKFINGKKEDQRLFQNSEMSLRNIRRRSLYIMLFGAFFSSVKIGTNIYRFLVYGYRSSYLGVSVLTGLLATIVDLFDGLYVIGFISYIATFPSIKQSKRYIMFYIVYAVSYLFTGTRHGFVTNTLFLIWYLTKLDMIDSKKTILTKKRIIILGIIGVLLVAFLYNYQYLRNGLKNENSSIIENFRAFFTSQGGSGRILSLCLQFEDEIDKYISREMIFLSPIVVYLRRNAISKVLFDFSSGQSLRSIYQYPSLSGTITYVTNPISYLSGGGLGSSYLAETVLSGGNVLLIIYSIIIGIVIAKIDNVHHGTWTSNYLLMTMFHSVIYIPRATALGFVPSLVLPTLYVLFIRFASSNYVYDYMV